MSSSVPSRAQWQQWVAQMLPNLSTSDAMNLGLLSYGMVMFDGSGMTRLSHGLAKAKRVGLAPFLEERRMGKVAPPKTEQVQ